jgi:nucleoside-diphosphate-sugar epimerase
VRTAFITGASGFIGQHLVAHLRDRGWRVVCARRVPRNGEAADLGPVPWTAARIAAALAEAQPDIVFHLAGLMRANSAAELYEANTILSAQVLDAALRQKHVPKVILAGSAAEYGPVLPAALPVAETHPCRPSTDYAVSKHAQTLMGLARARTGQPVLIGRIWNPVGAGMPGHMALANFASQIAAMASDRGVLRVGNLDVARDFIDVREMARLMVELAKRPDASGCVVNLCSGRAFVLAELVDRLIHLSGRRVELVRDTSRIRPGESAVLYGDTSRLESFGLQPIAPDFNMILRELLTVPTRSQ